jgi:hypothetical protein
MRIDVIEDGLSSTSYVERGYAGIGLAYARGAEAEHDVAKALQSVAGYGTEGLHERTLLTTALVLTGRHDCAKSLLDILPLLQGFHQDPAKHDVLKALSTALGNAHPAVRARRRVGLAPETLESEFMY